MQQKEHNVYIRNPKTVDRRSHVSIHISFSSNKTLFYARLDPTVVAMEIICRFHNEHVDRKSKREQPKARKTVLLIERLNATATFDRSTTSLRNVSDYHYVWA